MPTSLERAAWAEMHFNASERIGKLYEREWQTISMFYTANQLVKGALLMLPGLTARQANPEVHEGPDGTNRAVQRYASQGVARGYLGLFSASIDTRYNGVRVTGPEVEVYRRDYLVEVAMWACDKIHANPNCECWIRAKV